VYFGILFSNWFVGLTVPNSNAMFLVKYCDFSCRYIVAQTIIEDIEFIFWKNIKFVGFNGTGVEFIKFFTFLSEFVANS
jgi:hypothetical protein